MDEHTKRVVEACTRESDENSATFPVVVGRLMAAGVERYHADLVRNEKTYFMPDGDSHRVAAEPTPGGAPLAFSAVGVEAAVRTIQRGELTYAAFCAQILAAGCVGYFVTMEGRRAVYYGRTGETFVEHFPQAA